MENAMLSSKTLGRVVFFSLGYWPHRAGRERYAQIEALAR